MAGSVLVVEDDPAVVQSLRSALSPHGVAIEWAADADGAMALLDAHQFCGMVLDLVLRSGSGFDVLHHMGAKHMNVPTVVVTNKLPSYVREMLDAEHVKLPHI
jgi:DNA-binding response OmpR family regulator